MRELEFLPEWYPTLRRRKRLAKLQAWMALAIIASLSLWLSLARRNVRSAEVALGAFEVQVQQTETEKRQLNEQLEMKRQLERREEIVAQLGFPVEMSRLLQTLDTIMPREMSLRDINCTTEEQTSVAAGAAAAQATPGRPQVVDRRLRVRLVGVAPNDVDLADFLLGLTKLPFFEQISLVRADGVSDGGHLMREFEVTFSMNLNTTPGGE